MNTLASRFALVALIVTTTVSRAAADGDAALRAQPTIPSSFNNPVYASYLADPYCWNHNGYYYAIGTGRGQRGRDQSREVPMIKSRDLQHWEYVGLVLDLPKEEQGGAVWAPETAYDHGTFYLYYHANGAGQGFRIRVATSQHPAGPYTDTGTPLTDGAKNDFAIDSHAFRDDDGQWYLFYATDFTNHDATTFRGTALVVDRLIGMTRLEGKPKTVMRAHWAWQIYERKRNMRGEVADWYTLEGPGVVKRNGKYYCFYSGGNYQNDSYGVDYLVADHILGPWTEAGKDRGPQIVRSVPGQVIGPGHHSIVSSPDGKQDYFVYHAWNQAMTERQVWVDPLIWTPEGPKVERFQARITQMNRQAEAQRVGVPAEGANSSTSPAFPPGTVINHLPSATGRYVGSPSLAVLSNGDYVASHDEFGPQSTEQSVAITRVFHSRDRGASWSPLSVIRGQFWSTLFIHRGELYIMGTDKNYGNAVIRRSADGGQFWTTPTNAATGLLRADGQYHCAPMPVLEARGRLWRAFERRDPPKGWGITFCAGLLSVPVDTDLLNATNWTASNFLPGDAQWLAGDFGGWLEGSAVAAPDGHIVDILRVDNSRLPEHAAMVDISDDGRTASFDQERGLVPFPGGAKKFTIRFDPRTQLYWSVASIAQAPQVGKARPGGIRNSLGLVTSPDLRTWSTRCLLLAHPDAVKHGFQYVDWLFDGNDLIAVCRTAYDDAAGGAHNYHDANFLTFHRFTNFRTRTPSDPVSPVPP